MKDLKHAANPLFQNESDVDITIHSNEESDAEEDYHKSFSANSVRVCSLRCPKNGINGMFDYLRSSPSEIEVLSESGGEFIVEPGNVQELGERFRIGGPAHMLCRRLWGQLR